MCNFKEKFRNENKCPTLEETAMPGQLMQDIEETGKTFKLPQNRIMPPTYIAWLECF